MHHQTFQQVAGAFKPSRRAQLRARLALEALITARVSEGANGIKQIIQHTIHYEFNITQYLNISLIIEVKYASLKYQAKTA